MLALLAAHLMRPIREAQVSAHEWARQGVAADPNFDSPIDSPTLRLGATGAALNLWVADNRWANVVVFTPGAHRWRRNGCKTDALAI